MHFNALHNIALDSPSDLFLSRFLTKFCVQLSSNTWVLRAHLILLDLNILMKCGENIIFRTAYCTIFLTSHYSLRSSIYSPEHQNNWSMWQVLFTLTWDWVGPFMFTIAIARIKILKHDSGGNYANTPRHRLGASVLCTNFIYGLTNTHSTTCRRKWVIISLRSREFCKKNYGGRWAN